MRDKETDEHDIVRSLRPPIHDLDESDEPQEDDYTIVDSGPLLSLCSIARGSRFLGEYRDRLSALLAIQKDQELEQYYPATWYISDHGNPIALDLAKEIEDESDEIADHAEEIADRETIDDARSRLDRIHGSYGR